MKRKNRISFSDLSIDEKDKKTATSTNKKNDSGAKKKTKKTTQRKINKKIKSSTYQYSKRKFSPKAKSSKKGDKNMKIPPIEKGVVRIIPLGGVEEIGKNMTAIEIGDDIIVIDAGMYFSNEETPGVDYIIPNTTYLEENKEKIRALIITHGHLDHIGGVPIVLSRIGNPPVYSRNMSILLMRKRAAEFPQLPKMRENIIDKNSTITCGKIKVRFFGVTHTIPDSVGVIIETPNGLIVTPGDYKLDHIDGVVNKEEEKEYSIFDKEKVLLLMTDSTNIENEGFSLPEIKVHEGLENLITKINSRIIIAAFASHITRLAHIVRVAEKLGKKVAIDGRSMRTNIEVAIEAEYFEPKKGTIIPLEEVDNYPPHKVVILMTGAQGEEFAALNRAANKTHRKFTLHSGDTIILSASIVPGNELQVQRMKDNLTRQGVHIITYRTGGEDFVHATGHGNQEDIKWLHKKTHPKFFIPIHGHHSMLVRHKELAVELGMPEENIIVPDNGSVIEISADGKKITERKERAPANPMIVDGLAVSDFQDVVLRDRQMLSQDGMFVIMAVIDQSTGKLKKSPDLISRGFVYLKENQELLKQVRLIIKKAVEESISPIVLRENNIDFDEIKAKIGASVSKFLYQKTGKRPLVIPVVLSL
jgi:ribonuclease J